MSAINTPGQLRLTHTITVDKIDAATGQHVGQVTQASVIEGPAALLAFNEARGAQGLPPVTEDEARQMIDNQTEDE
jgi:hypothetical protein